MPAAPAAVARPQGREQGVGVDVQGGHHRRAVGPALAPVADDGQQGPRGPLGHRGASLAELHRNAVALGQQLADAHASGDGDKAVVLARVGGPVLRAAVVGAGGGSCGTAEEDALREALRGDLAPPLFQLDTDSLPPSQFCRDKGRAGSRERIKHRLAGPRDVTH